VSRNVAPTASFAVTAPGSGQHSQVRISVVHDR
jgi:hypothetical protein